MATTASSINTRSAMSPYNQIIKLKEYILGEMSLNSVNFLDNLCSKNEKSLNKLLLKLKKYNINIKAKDFDLVIKALILQASLSNSILQTIHCHLQDTNTNSLANLLIKRANDIENELPIIDTLKSILTVVDSLQIFSNQNREEKFIRSIIILMLNFHVKQHNNSHNNYLDSAKWLKTLLAISEKSNLIQLIDYIAIRLSIASIYINGDISNIELTEIFFSLEEMAGPKEIQHGVDNNAKIIKNINACILITIVCNKNPHAFVDVVASQLKDNKSNLPFLTREIFKQNSQLSRFYQNNKCNFLLKDTRELEDINLQALLMCFSNLLHEELICKLNEYQSEINLIKNFIIKCNNNSEKMLDDEYNNFIAKQKIETQTIDIFINNTLESILVKLKDSVKNSSSLSFIANKLTSLGFTPRSSHFSHLGMFAPIINKNKFQIDYDNMLELSLYINNLDIQSKSLIIKELFASLLVRYRANPYKLENQPKPMHSKQTNNCYQALIRHHNKNHIISETAKTNTANYQFTFFAKKPFAKRKPIPTPKSRTSVDIENSIMIR